MKITIDTNKVTKPIKKFSDKAADKLYQEAHILGYKSGGTLAIWFPKTYNRYTMWRIKKNLRNMK
jgi:hypothetical protein